MKLKIYNPEVVDCSSSWNEVVPNPQSKNLLLDIFVKLCESEAIRIITGHSLQLSFQKSSGIFGTRQGVIEFQSPKVYGFSNEGEYVPLSSHIKQCGETAELNKIDGLFLEPEINARERLLSYGHDLADKMYLIPPGLNGIRRSESIIKAYFSGNYYTLPNFLPKTPLTNFSISAGVIWKSWIKFTDDPKYGKVVDYSENRISDGISAESWEMAVNLGGICAGGHQGREKGDKHYPDIQKVLNENWPEMFQVQELNGG